MFPFWLPREHTSQEPSLLRLLFLVFVLDMRLDRQSLVLLMVERDRQSFDLLRQILHRVRLLGCQRDDFSL